MKCQYVIGSPLSSPSELLAICTFGDPTKDPAFRALDKQSKGSLKQQAAREDFTGKQGQVLLTYIGKRAIAVLGLGAKKKFKIAAIRDLAANAVKAGQKTGSKSVCFTVPTLAAGDVELGVQLASEGALLGSYKFSKYHTKNNKKNPVKLFQVATEKATTKKKAKPAKARGCRSAVKRGQAIAEGVCRARDLVNEPADAMTPAQMAKEARALARKKGMTAKVLGAKECERLGMGMFLAVARGSDAEPKLIHLIYKPKKKSKKVVALIGKGVTFDSGGYSLKPSSSMEDMKIDMSGAAAVIGAMSAIAEIGSPYEVHAIAACAENLVSGDAYKLGDVLKSMDGTTVEINNTDAEGRLTLGDAITYARAKVKPTEIFDFATLTGACMVALGPHTAAVMSDHDELAARWLAAAEVAGEDMWRMPLNKRLKEQLKSNIADMRNTGERWGGAITAGLFLQNFAKDTPWVHVDIAGPASVNRGRGAVPRGGTGFAVSTIVEYLTR
jgi:leucyl aminopeptidase